MGYKLFQNGFDPNIHSWKTTASIDKINSSLTVSSNSSNISKLVEGSSNSNNDYNIISSLDIEQLQLIFYLDLVLIYLLIMAIMFLLMKHISNLN